MSRACVVELTGISLAQGSHKLASRFESRSFTSLVRAERDRREFVTAQQQALYTRTMSGLVLLGPNGTGTHGHKDSGDATVFVAKLGEVRMSKLLQGEC